MARHLKAHDLLRLMHAFLAQEPLTGEDGAVQHREVDVLAGGRMIPRPAPAQQGPRRRRDRPLGKQHHRVRDLSLVAVVRLQGTKNTQALAADFFARERDLATLADNARQRFKVHRKRKLKTHRGGSIHLKAAGRRCRNCSSKILGNQAQQEEAATSQPLLGRSLSLPRRQAIAHSTS